MIDGVDLLPFVRGEAEGEPHRALFWRSGTSQSALVDGWKLNVSDPPGRNWLFDLGADPTEQRDLSAERPDDEALERLDEKIEAGLLAAAEPGGSPAARLKKIRGLHRVPYVSLFYY